MEKSPSSFRHGSGFETGQVSGNLHLGRIEGYYEELFAEIIEDGIITSEERARLDRLAESLGLDKGRLQKLEMALQSAYETRQGVRIREEGVEETITAPLPSLASPPAPAARPSVVPLELSSEVWVNALERRCTELQARVNELEKALADAQARAAVEVDLSNVSPPSSGSADDPEELARRLRQDPKDETTLHQFFRLYGKYGDLDRQWLIAQVLAFLNVAKPDELAFFVKHKGQALIRPKAALSSDAWKRLLYHHEEEALVGEIFAVVTPAVLLGRVSALRRDKLLPKLEPTKKQVPDKSTIQAVRCLSWAAAIFAMETPAIYADPDWDGAIDLVPAVPPAIRLGTGILSDKSPTELAFHAGYELALCREEHFVRRLVPQIGDLEEIFLAALSIGNPGLPLNSSTKKMVEPIAKAIEPMLEPVAVDRLRGAFFRFVEYGGRANLLRWANAVDRTATRAGFLLADDLAAVHATVKAEGAPRTQERLDDLVAFATSERYAKLRRQIGIAIENPKQS
jgi:hypothetical protein